MAFDIDAKIKELINKEGRLIAEIDSFQSNKEWKEVNKKSKELEKVRQELLKYRNLKSMMNKDTAEILRLSGFTVDADPISYLNKQVWVKHEANGQIYKGIINKESGNMVHVVLPSTGQSAWKAKNQVELVKDEEVSPKFKKVMEEYGKGELKSSSGEKVTDPKQAKAIAYSEAGEAKDGDITEFWTKEQAQYVVQHPQLFKPVIVELAKKYLAKYFKDDDATKEGAIKEYGKEKGSFEDSCEEKVFTKGTEDADPKVAEAESIINLCGGVK